MSNTRRTLKQERDDLMRQLAHLESGKGTVITDQPKPTQRDRAEQIDRLKRLIAEL